MSFTRELREAILRRKGWRIVSKEETEKLLADIRDRQQRMKSA